ncbi:MAG: hypothetical protein ACE37F_09480 [Nannocystaceae bacterium]|nr:hypothetical protein [bacterium]
MTRRGLQPFPAATASLRSGANTRRAGASTRANIEAPATSVAIVLLARAFDALKHAAGLAPWNPDALYHWAVDNLYTDAERHCARFILSVWNQDDFEELDAEHDGRLRGFDSLRTVASWDHAHRAAFTAWTLDPWWP